MAKVPKVKSKPAPKIGHTVKTNSKKKGMDEEQEMDEEQGMDEPQVQLDPCVISASEDEDGSDDERKNRKLLEAISSLGGKKRKKLGERTEASIQVSEFTVNAEGEGVKINLSDLIGTMEKTPAVLSKTKKQLHNLQGSETTLETPLSRQQTEKIHRQVAFDKTAKEVSRWQGVVTQNQRAEQLVFPLNQEPSGPKRMEQVVAGWKAQTPLEQEIFSLLHVNRQPTHDPVLTPRDETALRAMSLEEAKIRRGELQKARALQSYYESKAKRERKIKSKQYHRVQKKAKRKEFLKQFDDMLKTDPDAALEELKRLELSRMQERMSLKHQNSGKWAKSKAIIAKYDEGARKAMQQQLEVNKDLTQKLVAPPDEEEDEDEEEEPGALPDFVNDAEPLLDPVNPWMRGKLSAEPTGQEVDDGAEASVVGPGETEPPPEEEEEEEEEEEAEEEVLLREFEARRKLRKADASDVVPRTTEDDEETPEENGAEMTDENRPEAPETTEGNRPEAPETTEGNRPEEPETTEENRPKVPEENRPEAPETMKETRPEEPETTEENRPEAPETTEGNRPEEPETTDENRPEAPETTEENRPEAPETTEENRPGAPETTEENRPEEPETTEENRPEEPETTEENAAEAEVVETSDDEEEEDLSEFTSLFQVIASSQREPAAPPAQPEPGQGPAPLEEGLVRVRTLEDMELLGQNALPTDQPAPPTDQTPAAKETSPASPPRKAERKRKRKKEIDLSEVLTKEAKMIKVPMAPTAVEAEEEEEEEVEMDEQRTIIKEAFAGDDVVSDFLKDKRKQEEAGRPKVVDLTLPGWGEWGGQGLKPSRRKRKRFRVKAPPPPPRRDEKLNGIIISEKRDSSIAVHQVSQLPFPFENPTQFERTLRSPVGHTWNTQQTVKKITAPKVVTKLGTIIDPMSREELMRSKRQTLPDKGPNIPLDSGKGNQRKRSQKRSHSHKAHKN